MVYFSISLEKGNWLKLKEESNLHFIHQLSKDLHLKIIFKITYIDLLKKEQKIMGISLPK